MLGAPNAKTVYEIDNEYMINNEITVAGSNVGSIKDVKDML
jgi:D-arabinose 1-dehydrogenase-like Zn-dependent alcohol dehydrogenase